MRDTCGITVHRMCGFIFLMNEIYCNLCFHRKKPPIDLLCFGHNRLHMKMAKNCFDRIFQRVFGKTANLGPFILNGHWPIHFKWWIDRKKVAISAHKMFITYAFHPGIDVIICIFVLHIREREKVTCFGDIVALMAECNE